MSKYEFDKNFTGKINKFVANTEQLMLDVTKNALQDLIEDATRPVKEGGRMPVDTGFLRLSGTGAINEIPKGETKGRERLPGEVGEIYKSNPSGSVASILEKLKLGDTFYYGWTARYAIYQEFKHGFLVSHCAKWQEYIKRNVKNLSKTGFTKFDKSVNLKYNKQQVTGYAKWYSETFLK